MKVCELCQAEFTPKGRQKVCNECKNAVQKGVSEGEATRPERPLERFGSGRFVFGGGSGVLLRR